VGGSVSIESEPGKGTTVVLHLPIAARGNETTLTGAARRAVVSIRDRRGTSVVSAILRAGGFEVAVLDGREPPPSRLWVLEPGAAAHQRATQYLKGDQHRRIVIFGPCEADWRSLSAFVIDDPADFDMIRRTLGEALAAVSSEPT
jgi:hypothetical protein